MEGVESILDSIHEEDNIESVEDVEMLDIEEGEFIEDDLPNGQREIIGGDVNPVNRETQSKNRKRRNKKNRKKNSGMAPNVTDVNRFVLQACKRLKEKKQYMVYTAVGCLGLSALSDLIKEVDAIQVCGGQMTADGRRHRTGGGVLWSIIKSREPKAYKEIMKRTHEFEKQFRQQNIRQGSGHSEGASQESTYIFSGPTTVCVSDGVEPVLQTQIHPSSSTSEEKRVSVHSRIRVPVSYDDILGDDPKDDAHPDW